MHLPSMGFRLAGIVCQVQAVPSRLLVDGFPPTIFVQMPRDSRTAQGVEENAAKLRAQRTRVAQIRVMPLPIDAQYFARNTMRRISPAQSAAMAAALASQSKSLLNVSGYLRADPRRSRWRAVLRPLSGSDALVADKSPIAELLNVAFAQHEMTADHIDATLDFLLVTLRR
ncbi:hypothetical protein T492DRAFT_1055946 [Pavlovales sp. CCMP2436]|nr:hypothetical protein T492DRAFT_1055946 [Pavlovales sp. CCMP2436]